MNRRSLYQTLIPAAGISSVIVALLAKSGLVWVVGALVVGLITVLATDLRRGPNR